jgi:hypothetical protein
VPDLPVEMVVPVSTSKDEDATEIALKEEEAHIEPEVPEDDEQEISAEYPEDFEPSAMAGPAALTSSKDPSWELGLGLGTRVLRLEGISSAHSPWKWSPELQLHFGYRLSDRHSLEIELRAFENTGTYESVEFSSLVYGFGPVNQKREIYASPSLQFEIPIRWRYRINERSFSSVGVFYAHQLPMEVRVVDHHEEWYSSELTSDQTSQAYIEGFRYQNFGLSGSYQYRLKPKWLISGDLQYYFLDRDMIGSSAIANTPWSLGISIRYSLIR